MCLPAAAASLSHRSIEYACCTADHLMSTTNAACGSRQGVSVQAYTSVFGCTVSLSSVAARRQLAQVARSATDLSWSRSWLAQPDESQSTSCSTGSSSARGSRAAHRKPVHPGQDDAAPSPGCAEAAPASAAQRPAVRDDEGKDGGNDGRTVQSRPPPSLIEVAASDGVGDMFLEASVATTPLKRPAGSARTISLRRRLQDAEPAVMNAAPAAAVRPRGCGDEGAEGLSSRSIGGGDGWVSSGRPDVDSDVHWRVRLQTSPLHPPLAEHAWREVVDGLAEADFAAARQYVMRSELTAFFACYRLGLLQALTSHAHLRATRWSRASNCCPRTRLPRNRCCCRSCRLPRRCWTTPRKATGLQTFALLSLGLGLN